VEKSKKLSVPRPSQLKVINLNDPEVLVVNATGSPIIEDTLVQVTGTVRKFVVSEIEKEFI